MSYVNFEAFFLGPKGENSEFYQRLLKEMLDQHVIWRKAFHADSTSKFISDDDKQLKSFKDAQEKIQNTLYTLQEILKSSQPFFSPRYIGHMNWEVMMAAVLAYFSASLYNPNNVAFAGSTGTTLLELEVGKDLLNLFGIDPVKGWGHICTGGTIANMEALWIARNMKMIPLVLQTMLKNFIEEKKIHSTALPDYAHSLLGQKHHELLNNYSPAAILNLKEKCFALFEKQLPERIDYKNRQRYIEETFDKLCMQTQGFTWNDSSDRLDLGVVYLPQSKHYSFSKAMDLLGMGRKNLRFVPVDSNFRLDVNILENMLFNEERPILSVICVMGSTEESSVDEVHKVVSLRDKLEKEKGKSFHLHIDAAYGGYARALFLDEMNQFMSKEQLKFRLREFGIIGDKADRLTVSWPSDVVYESYEAMKDADTITVDPHKLGYIPYPAGGIVLKDKRMREAIHAFAPYVFGKPEKNQPDILIGSYILEGSKPGAAAAAVWTAHRVMPLNISGYGKLIGETIDGAHALFHGLQTLNPVTISENITIQVYVLAKPDLNIVNYIFNFSENSNLQKLNRLTAFIASKIFGPDPIKSHLMLEKSFIVSTTALSQEEYGDIPFDFLKRIGISLEEWHKVQNLQVIRSVVMSPYLTTDFVDENYVEKFRSTIEKELIQHSDEIRRIYLLD
jgi:tyrosine decarboxylase